MTNHNHHSMHSLVVELVGPKPLPDPMVQDLYPYVIFSSRSDGLLHAEIPSNLMLHPRYTLDEDACDFCRMTGWDEGEVDWYLDFPIEDAGEVADRVMMAFRQHFRVAHPHLLTYRAWGDAGPDGAILNLCGTKDVPLDQPMKAPAREAGGSAPQDHEALAVEPDDRDHLLQIIGRILRETWVRWTLRDRDIWQTVLLPGNPFVPSHLDTLLDLFHNAMTATRDDLAYRTGARVS